MPRTDTVKIVLPESDIPTAWYNILPDLPGDPLPPLHPGTGEPVGPADLAPLFPKRSSCRRSRASGGSIFRARSSTSSNRGARPMYRAHRLEKTLGLTPGKQRIYYKWEGVSPGGSHKPNTAVPQAFYNKAAGTDKLTTETGAGQWGSSLAYACALFGSCARSSWSR